MSSDDSCQSFHPETLAIRGGRETSEYREHSQSLYLTSSFTFESAAQAAAMFLGEIDGYTYSRFTNPTVSAFQQRLAQMEGGERAIATASCSDWRRWKVASGQSPLPAVWRRSRRLC